MKQIKNHILIFASFVLLSAFLTKKPVDEINIKKDFVRLNERLLLSKYEVSNADYKKFMAYLKSTNQDDLYSRCLLDTTKWDIRPETRAFKNTYHAQKAFDNYPVVTVSFEAANEYCTWLTTQYNANAERQYQKVIFRLPTEEEWVDAASGGNKSKIYPWDNYYLRNNKGEFLCNFLRLGDQSIYFDSKTNSYKVADVFIGDKSRTVLFNPVDGYPASPSGLFNLSGNAAEMVAEKGLAKGGSYNDPGYDVRISSKKFYDGPSTEIGFRVLIEILEK